MVGAGVGAGVGFGVGDTTQVLSAVTLPLSRSSDPVAHDDVFGAHFPPLLPALNIAELHATQELSCALLFESTSSCPAPQAAVFGAHGVYWLVWYWSDVQLKLACVGCLVGAGVGSAVGAGVVGKLDGSGVVDPGGRLASMAVHTGLAL